MDHLNLYKYDYLYLAVHIINNTAVIDLLVPNVFVFGFVLQFPLVFSDIHEQIERMNLLHKSRGEMSKSITTFRIRTALSLNVPSASYDEVKIISQAIFCIKVEVMGRLYVFVVVDEKILWLNINN